jgi:predicted molibdopterin-dependent oxidoreductase YjgC
VDAIARVPFVVVMATHEGPELDRAHVVLPAAGWAEEDGTFTNYQRRVQRVRRAAAVPGQATARWELAEGLLERMGAPLQVTSPRELFARLAASLPDYEGLDYRVIGAQGRTVALEEGTATAPEARA